MSYRIIYDDRNRFYDEVAKETEKWLSQLENLRARLDVLTQLDSFRGETADAVRDYFSNVHGMLQMYLEYAIYEFCSELAGYAFGYYEIDFQNDAVLPEEGLETVKRRLEYDRTKLLEGDRAIRGIVNEVDDLISVRMPYTGDIINALDEARLQISTLDNRIQQYETRWKRVADTSLAATIESVTKAIDKHIYRPKQAWIYGLGYIPHDFRIIEFQPEFVAMMSLLLQKMSKTAMSLMVMTWFSSLHPNFGRHIVGRMTFSQKMHRELSKMELTADNLERMEDYVEAGFFLTNDSPLIKWIRRFMPRILWFLRKYPMNIVAFDPVMLFALVGGVVGAVGMSVMSGNPEITSNSISDAVLKGSISGNGKFLGFNTGGELSGELLGYSAKYETDAKFELKFDENGKLDMDSLDVKAGVSGSLEGHVAKGEASGNVGYLNGSIEGTAITGAVKGETGISLFEDGKFTPSVYAEVGAEGSVLEGEAEVYFGDKDNNIHAEAEGALLTAGAGAEAGAGRIKVEDITGEEKAVWGVKAEAKAEAYLAEGSVSGGVSIFGIDIDVELEGKAGGAGAGAGGYLASNGMCGEFDLGLGVGAGVKVEIDWTGFEMKWPWE